MIASYARTAALCNPSRAHAPCTTPTRPRHNIIKNDLRHSLRLLCFAHYVSLVRGTTIFNASTLNSVTVFYNPFVLINSLSAPVALRFSESDFDVTFLWVAAVSLR